MIQDLAAGLEQHFMTAVVVSGALALLIVAVVAFSWWKGRRWIKRRGGVAWPNSWNTNSFSNMDEPIQPRSGTDPGTSNQRPSGGGGAEQTAARLVREAAARAAGLRDAWDRSYREARSSSEGGTGEPAPPSTDVAALLDELLREQRQTNALLREMLTRLPRGD